MKKFLLSLFFSLSASGSVWKVAVPVVFHGLDGKELRTRCEVPARATVATFLKCVRTHFLHTFPGAVCCIVEGIEAFPEIVTPKSIKAFLDDNEFVFRQVAMDTGPCFSDCLFIKNQLEKKDGFCLLTFNERATEPAMISGQHGLKVETIEVKKQTKWGIPVSLYTYEVPKVEINL